MQMKKIVLAMALFASTILVAGPHGPGFGGPGLGGMHPPRHGFHGPHHDGWGRGGRGFWPGFVGGLVGSMVAPHRPPPPPPAATVVVAPPPPPPSQVRVWVPGCYVDEVQPNGAVVRRWIPGHYEWR